MEVSTFLRLPPEMCLELWRHLLPGGPKVEQAAFLFCRGSKSGRAVYFDVIEPRYLRPSEFAVQAGDYIELTDETRIDVIKQAHRLEACLVEIHSHPGPYPAAFSTSDKIGLHETVPHMQWRLNNRPYVALVVAPTGYDGLVFFRGPDTPVALTGIQFTENLLTPTNISLESWNGQRRNAI